MTTHRWYDLHDFTVFCVLHEADGLGVELPVTAADAPADSIAPQVGFFGKCFIDDGYFRHLGGDGYMWPIDFGMGHHPRRYAAKRLVSAFQFHCFQLK